jgi:hypothetical protein
MKKFAFGAAVIVLAGLVAADLMAHLVQEGAPPTIVVIPSDQSLMRLASTALTDGPNSRVTKVAHGIGIGRSATATSLRGGFARRV